MKKSSLIIQVHLPSFLTQAQINELHLRSSQGVDAGEKKGSKS